METHTDDYMPHESGIDTLNEAEFFPLAKVFRNVRSKVIEEVPCDCIILFIHTESSTHNQEDLLRVLLHVVEECDVGRQPLLNTLADITGLFCLAEFLEPGPQ